jgi:tetratricopeptide (TPR) repeat protein
VGIKEDPGTDLVAEASTLAGNEKFDEALSLFERALELQPEDCNAIYGVAFCQRNLGNVTAAQNALDSAGNACSDDRRLPQEAGLLAQQRGRYDDALSWFAKALDIDPDYEKALIGQVTVLRRQRLWVEAETRAREAIDRLPHSPGASVEMGWVYSDQQRYDDALPWFAKALDIDPDHEDAQIWQVTVLRLTRRWAGAEDALDEATMRNPHSVQLWVERGWLMSTSNRLPEAEEAFTRALDEDDSSPEGLLGLGALDFQRKNYREAEKRFREVLGLRQDPVDRTNLAWSLIRQGGSEKLEEAERLCRQALTDDHESTSALNCLAVAAFARGHLRSSEAYLRKTIAIGGDEGSHTDLGALLAHMGRSDEAEEQLKKAIDVDWFDVQAHLELGALLAQRGDPGGAQAAFLQAHRADSMNADAIGALASALAAEGDGMGAEKLLRDGLRHCDRNEHAALHLGLARLLIVRGDATQRPEFYSEALLEASEAIKNLDIDANAYFYAGVARYKLASVTTSTIERAQFRISTLRYFTRCLEVDPYHYEAQRNRDLILREIARSRRTVYGGAILGAISLAAVGGMWAGFFLSDRVTPVMVTTLTPILFGLLLLSLLLPALSSFKLPGLEASLNQQVEESVAAGPVGINLGPDTPTSAGLH